MRWFGTEFISRFSHTWWDCLLETFFKSVLYFFLTWFIHRFWWKFRRHKHSTWFMSRWGLPATFQLTHFLFLLLFLTHPVEICPKFLFSKWTRSLAFGILHLFEVILFMLFIVITIAFILDGEKADLIFFFHFFRDYFKVILQKINLFISFDQPSKEWTLLDIGCCHFVDDFDGKKMMSFCFNHSLLFLDHVDIIISEWFDGGGLLVIHAAQSELSRHCEMSQG